MQIGFIHSDTDELKKVSQLWKLLTEEGAIDELGIGRIRDYFSDTLFPGTSTLWKHAKYFVLLPKLYMYATQRTYNSRREVREHIIHLERKMTENLMNNTPLDKQTGITGSDSIKNNTKFVKYDPTYIYSTGMKRYGILKDGDLEGMIWAYSKKIQNLPDKHIQQSEEDMSDSEEGNNIYQFCSCPTGDVESFNGKCSLELTKDEAIFLQNHIISSPDTKGTLLNYLLNTLPKLPKEFKDFDISTVKDSNIQDTYNRACTFSKFIYGAHLYYNYVLSNNTDEKIYAEFQNWKLEWKTTGFNIKDVIADIHISETSSIDFCIDFENHLNAETYLDSIVTDRERKIKKSRHKIGKGVYDPKHPYHHYYLTFRWEIVKVLVDEIKAGLQNG